MYPTSTSVTSCLLTAAAWDRTLNFLVESKAITKAEVWGDGVTWGNYVEKTFEFDGKYSIDDGESYDESKTTKPENKFCLLGTGVAEDTEKKNIYDLAGNLSEWTTEAQSSEGRVSRGGSYYSNEISSPANCRDDSMPKTTRAYVGFRPTLYISL